MLTSPGNFARMGHIPHLGLPILERDRAILVALQAKLAQFQESAGGVEHGTT